METNIKGSFRAFESIPAYRLVSVATTSSQLGGRMIELCETSSTNPIGVIQDDVSTNGACDVVLMGIARAQCILSVSAGGQLTMDTGTGMVKEHGLTSITVQVVGIALEDGSTNGVIDILLTPHAMINN